MRVLLTGATGFIGAHLLARLREEGHAVTVLVVPETLELLPRQDHVKVVLGYLNDRRALSEATKDAEIVLHLAGKILGSSASDLNEVNVQGTANLLVACAASRVRRFVFVSSASVYRPALSPNHLPIVETDALGPIGSIAFKNYANSKIEAERLVLQSWENHGLQYSILRPTIAYGLGQGLSPGPMESSVLNILWNARRLLSGTREGNQMQWVHVLDLTPAIIRAGTVPEARNQIFTIAGAELFDVPTITAMMLDILWPASLTRFSCPSLTPMVYPNLVFDTTKARKMLGYEAKIDLRMGLSQMLDDMRRNGRLPVLFPGLNGRVNRVGTTRQLTPRARR